MGIPPLKQNFQDWITQQWVILFGKKIDGSKYQWLLGPFGKTDGIGKKFINQLAIQEDLEIDQLQKNKGLLQSIDELKLNQIDLDKLKPEVVDFYENTSNYDLDLTVNWNPFFRIFGGLLKVLFSNRLDQLNVPMNNRNVSKKLNSEIIHLKDKSSNSVKRTIWFRTFAQSKKVVYSGVYETCIIPNGQSCIKAIFPLPNGNATVILTPIVGDSGELRLQSSGKKIGDSGFYFLLNDSKGQLWTKFIKSFRDELVVSSKNGKITAIQTLTMWKLRVLTFEYKIKKSQ